MQTKNKHAVIVVLCCLASFLLGWMSKWYFITPDEKPLVTIDPKLPDKRAPLIIDPKPGKEFVPVVVNRFCTLELADKATLHVVNNKGNLVLALKSTTKNPWYMTVYNDQKNVVFDLARYPDGGIRELIVRAKKKPVFARGFYENGAVRYISEFESKPGHPTKEIRKYFDRKGNPTKTETNILHST